MGISFQSTRIPLGNEIKMSPDYNIYPKLMRIVGNVLYADEPWDGVNGQPYQARSQQYQTDGTYLGDTAAPEVAAYRYGSSVGNFCAILGGHVITCWQASRRTIFQRVDNPQTTRERTTIYTAPTDFEIENIAEGPGGAYLFWVERDYVNSTTAQWKKATYDGGASLTVFDQGDALDFFNPANIMISSWCDSNQGRFLIDFADDSFAWVIGGSSNNAEILEINGNKELVNTETWAIDPDLTDNNVTLFAADRFNAYLLRVGDDAFYHLQRINDCGPIPETPVTPFIIPCEVQLMGFLESPRFPEDIAYGSTGGPGYSTTVITMASGHEQRNVNWEQSRHRYRIGYGTLDRQRLEQLIHFFHAVQGRAYGFRMKDYHDHKSSLYMDSAITSTDQTIGTGDGVVVDFQLTKTYAAGANTRARDIRKPVAGSVLISLDDAPQATGWTVDVTTGIVTFDTAPGAGVVIKAGYEFDVPCRFDTDEIAVALSDYKVSATDVPIVEVRV